MKRYPIMRWIACASILLTTASAFGGWNRIWNDTFNNFNTSKWSKGFPWGKTNQVSPDTYYPDSNVWTSNGALVLQADSADYNGYEWTGAAVNTYNKFYRSKGTRIIARIKAPHRNGINPAFWMIAQDRQWPPEIDIFEFPGAMDNGGKKVWMTVHYPGGKRAYTWNSSSKLTGSAHNYEMRWFEGSRAIEWYIDGVKRAGEYNNSYTPNENMYIVLSIVVANNSSWHGTPANEGWNSKMQVYWIEGYDQT